MKGHRPRLAAGLSAIPAPSHVKFNHAPHIRAKDRVRDVPRPDRPADRGAAHRGPDHGLLRELSQGEAGAARLPDLPLLMDRRSFIKLTAVSGTTAALTSCGSPENTLVRFVPDEDIVPGQATWKPSVCPMCASGCGLTVRVMDADHDVVRERPGRRRAHLRGEEAGGQRRPPGEPRRAVHARPGGDSGHLSPRPHHAAAEAIGQPRRGQVPGRLVGRRDRGAGGPAGHAGRRRAISARWRCWAAARGGHRALVVQQFLAQFGAPAAGHLGAVRRRRGAARQRAQLRPRAAADVRPGQCAVRHQLRRRLPGHLELAGVAEPRATARCGRAAAASAARSCRWKRACRRPAPTPTSGCRSGPAPTPCWRSVSRMR